MKKTILSLALVLAIGIGASYAAGKGDGNLAVRSSLKKDFESASIIRLDNYKAFTKATFTMNGHIMFAYYTTQGDLLAIARNVLSDELPINLKSKLAKHYSDYWITDLFEVSSDGNREFYVTLENSDEVLVLKSNGDANWESYAKRKKDSE